MFYHYTIQLTRDRNIFVGPSEGKKTIKYISLITVQYMERTIHSQLWCSLNSENRILSLKFCSFYCISDHNKNLNSMKQVTK